MTLPPWRSARKEDQEALTRFVLDELDRDDEQSVRDAGENEEGIRHLSLLVELADVARKLGIPLPVSKRTRRGPKPRDPADMTDFDRAEADVRRIRAIFMRHWGKRNRTVRPMAEEIAAERWELSAEETARLIAKIQRKS